MYNDQYWDVYNSGNPIIMIKMHNPLAGINV